MTVYDSVDSSVTGDPDGGLDAAFRAALAVYGGALLAGLAAIATALPEGEFAGLITAYAVGFAVGAAAGLVLSSVDPHLPFRIGRTLARRLALVAPAALFAVAWFAPLESAVDAVAVWSMIAVFAAGYVLSQLANNRYVDAVVPGDPEETWRWEPPGSVRLDIALFALYVALGAGNAASGNRLQALVWLSLGVGWLASCLVEGRWSFGPGRDRCAIQIYETGLVKRRPYTRSFVPWDEIDHARLREGELVLDRGLRDVRFDRDELEDAAAVLEAVDRRLARSMNR